MRMTLRVLFAVTIAFGPGRAFSAPSTFRGAGFDEALSGEAVLSTALRLASIPSGGLPVSVHLLVERAEVERSPGTYDFTALDARIALYGRQGVRMYVDLRDAVPPLDAIDGWSRFVRAVATRYRTRASGYIFGALPTDSHPSARDYAFYVKSTVISLRAAGDDGTAAILRGVRDSDAAWLDALYSEDVAPYLDAIGIEEGNGDTAPILAAVEKGDPSATVLLLGQSLGQDPSAAPRLLLDHQLSILATRISGVTYAAPPPVVAAALRPLASLREFLGRELIALDEQPAGLRLTSAGQDAVHASNRSASPANSARATSS
jgi:hypothetical protein